MLLHELSHCPNVHTSDHAQMTLSKHCRIKHTMKSTLIAEKVANMRVLDNLGSITNRSTLADQLEPLKRITARDNVHLTNNGFIALASGIVKEAQYFLDRNKRNPNRQAPPAPTGIILSVMKTLGKLTSQSPHPPQSTPSKPHDIAHQQKAGPRLWQERQMICS